MNAINARDRRYAYSDGLACRRGSQVGEWPRRVRWGRAGILMSAMGGKRTLHRATTDLFGRKIEFGDDRVKARVLAQRIEEAVDFDFRHSRIALLPRCIERRDPTL